MPTPTTPRTRAPAARHLAPTLMTLFLAACAHESAPHGGTPAAPAPAVAAAPGANVAWPPHLREWAEKARTEYGVPTLDAAAAAALPEGVVIVDVRDAKEVAVSAMPGAMALTSEQTRGEFARQAAGETVLVYCTVGWRSAQYTQQLVAAGAKAFNLDGGLCAWAAAGRPLVDRKGQPTTRIHACSKDFADCVPPGFVAVTD